MKNVLLYLVFVFMIVGLFGLSYSVAQEKEPAGKKVFVDKKCGSCHSVESAGLTSKKKDAHDLSNAGAHDAEFLAKYLNKEEKIDGKAHKSAVKGTEEELKQLTEWLASLKAKK